MSVGFDDPKNRQWRQVLAHCVGEARDGAIRLRGEGLGDVEGMHKQHTLDFIPKRDGSVSQWFQESGDGETWKTTFGGICIRAAQ
jgi:hypothetical protein